MNDFDHWDVVISICVMILLMIIYAGDDSQERSKKCEESGGHLSISGKFDDKLCLDEEGKFI